jgi:pimeloyl-ACP methyl ester carboxylesterase
MAAVHTKTVTANGLEFAYLEEGEGPLVLLLHGFPDTAHSWDAVLPRVADQGFRVVAPFMRGYYPSEIPSDGPFDSDTLGRDALALIESLDEDKAILVGHDWGASAAYSAAGIDSSKLSLLVTMAIPHPASLRPTPKLLWNMRHFLTLRRRGAAARVRKDDFAMIDTLVRRWSPEWDVPASETKAVKRAFREPGCLEAALGYYRAAGVRLPAGQRNKVDVPGVAFAGLHDVIAPREYGRARNRYTKSYEIVQVPGGHFMHREHPIEFIDEFLAVLRAHRND